MRVIAGKCKGLSLRAVKGMNTRPTTDKIKESIFNIIGPFFKGGIGLDLFAGSGGLGIEALSRGTEKVIFVDRDNKAVETIHENIKQCGLQEQVEVYRNESTRALKAITKRGLTFSIIFLDPPYKRHMLNEILEFINENKLLDQNGVIVVEHDSKVELPALVGTLNCIRKETYGTTAVSIYITKSLEL